MAKILKYVDDSKVIAKITTEDDVDKLQTYMENIYEWESRNNMKYNREKFGNLGKLVKLFPCFVVVISIKPLYIFIEMY